MARFLTPEQAIEELKRQTLASLREIISEEERVRYGLTNNSLVAQGQLLFYANPPSVEMVRCRGCGGHFTPAKLQEHLAACEELKRLP